MKVIIRTEWPEVVVKCLDSMGLGDYGRLEIQRSTMTFDYSESQYREMAGWLGHSLANGLILRGECEQDNDPDASQLTHEEEQAANQEYLNTLSGHNQEMAWQRAQDATAPSDAQIEYEAELAMRKLDDQPEEYDDTPQPNNNLYGNPYR